MRLLVNSPGASLRKENDCLLVSTKQEKRRFSAAALRSISVHPGASVSADVLLWAIRHEIDFLVLDRRGQPQGRVWSHRYGSISTIRKNQLRFSQSLAATRWIIDINCEKLENCAALLFSHLARNSDTEETIRNSISELNRYRGRLIELKNKPLDEVAPTIRGLEGSASRAYFKVLPEVLPKPYRFTRRSQHPARDWFNCLLNYAYGILYGRIEGILIRKGLDPYVGILHADEYNRPVLVYDIIERYRIWADYVVVDLCQQQVLHDAHFSLTTSGGCWLEVEGRRWLIQQMHDYLEDTILHQGKSITREAKMELDCQQLATNMKEGKF